MTTRRYSSKSQQATLTTGVTSGAGTITINSSLANSLIPGGSLTAGQTYTLVIDPDTSLEEIVEVTAYTSGKIGRAHV